MLRKIHIGLICEKHSDAEQFILTNVNCAQKGIDGKVLPEQDYFVFHYIKPYSNFKAMRLNQVYVNKEIMHSDWFKVVIYPLLTGSIGDIHE